MNPVNDGTITEKRTRFVCTIGSSSDKQLPDIKADTVIYRVCDNQGGRDCHETGEFFLIEFHFFTSKISFRFFR
jgi:hypothetical protein